MWPFPKKQMPTWAGQRFLRSHWRHRLRLLVEELEPRNSPAGVPIANVQVTADPGVQQMPSVAVDPLNSNHLVMAYLDYSLINPGYTAQMAMLVSAHKNPLMAGKPGRQK